VQHLARLYQCLAESVLTAEGGFMYDLECDGEYEAALCVMNRGFVYDIIVDWGIEREATQVKISSVRYAILLDAL
jgi:hypothetical protein